MAKKKILEIIITGYEDSYGFKCNAYGVTLEQVLQALNHVSYQFVKDNPNVITKREYFKLEKKNFKQFEIEDEREEN